MVTLTRDNSVIGSAISSVENAKGIARNESRTHAPSVKKGENKKQVRRRNTMPTMTLEKLRKKEARRSPKARAVDESRKHSVVVHPINKKGVEQWMKDPSSADIRGVDTPGSVTKAAKSVLHERAENLKKHGKGSHTSVKQSPSSEKTGNSHHKKAAGVTHQHKAKRGSGMTRRRDR